MRIPALLASRSSSRKAEEGGKAVQINMHLARHLLYTTLESSRTKGLDSLLLCKSRYTGWHIGSEPGLTHVTVRFPHTTTPMLKHVTTPRVVFEPESMIILRVYEFLTSVRANYETTKLLKNLLKLLLFCRFPGPSHFLCSYVVM